MSTSKFKLQTRFQSNGSRLYVKASETKRGVVTSVSIRNIGQKLQTGMRTEFAFAEKSGADDVVKVKRDATTEFDKLVASALKAGWIERVKKVRVSKTAFDVMPVAPTVVPAKPIVPPVAATKKPATVKV